MKSFLCVVEWLKERASEKVTIVLYDVSHVEFTGRFM